MLNKKVSKLNVMLVGFLLLTVSTIGVVWAVNRTITDYGSYQNDSVYTMIRNSKGNYWSDLTESSLQAAIWDLNSTNGGWVDVPFCNITFTTTLWITSGVWLRGAGNASVLWLANNANKTMIKNVHQNTGDINIRISDIRLEGNMYNQPIWWTINANRYKYAHGIVLKYTNHSSIDNVVINNITSGGIIWYHCSNITTDNVYVFNPGHAYNGTGYTHWWAKGVMYDSCENGVIDSCFVNNSFANGIVIESVDAAYGTPLSPYTKNIVVSNCFVNKANAGFYCENAKEIIFTNCIAINCNKWEVYGDGYGFLAASTTYRILYDSCIASYCGNLSGTTGVNYINSGKNNTYSNCLSSYGKKDGFFSYGRDNKYIGCTSSHDARFGFGGETYNVTYDGCNVQWAGDVGIFLNAANKGSNRGSIVSNCHIFNCGSASGGYQDGISCFVTNVSIVGNIVTNHYDVGISVASTARFCIISNNIISNSITSDDGISIASNNCTINGNVITKCDDGIYLSTTCYNVTVALNNIVSCTKGISESSSAKGNIILGNQCQYCTTPIDVNGAGTIYGYNQGKVS